MFGTGFRGANAYAQVGMETQITSASPHQLITMLFDGAMTAVTNAIQHMSDNDIPAKGKSISHAILIIESGLRGALDHKAGGEIAANLDALYMYMTQTLLRANLENNPNKLKEVLRLLDELRTAWAGIDPSRRPAVSEHNESFGMGNPAMFASRFAEVAA